MQWNIGILIVPVFIQNRVIQRIIYVANNILKINALKVKRL